MLCHCKTVGELIEALKSFDQDAPLSMSMTCEDPENEGWTIGLEPKKEDCLVSFNVDRGGDGRCVISNHSDDDVECCRGC